MSRYLIIYILIILCVDTEAKKYYYNMMDLERLETYTLTNEELQREIRRLTAEIGNLQVQVSEYRQIVAELSARISSVSDKN